MSAIHVFDTYATAANGRILHFDVVIPENDPEQAVRCARDWLRRIGHGDASVSPQQCCYCHTEALAPSWMQEEIAACGYAIYKLEGCPS